jgi:phage shock protein A
MPGLADRFSTVAAAKLSQLLDRAEAPGEVLDYAYACQLDALVSVKPRSTDRSVR